MIKKLYVTGLFFLISFGCLAMTIINQSNVPVAFSFHNEEYLQVIDLNPGDTFQLAENLQNQLFMSHVGQSGVLRFHLKKGDNLFFRTDTGAHILFKIENPGKICPMSAYQTMIIKNANSETYDGLAIELQKTIGQKVYEFFDFSDMKCSVQ